MFSNRSNPPLCQVSMFNTSPISRKCDITVRTCKLLRHIIPLEEIDRNCLQLSYALFFGLIHISLTFSERDVGTALSYRDKNHFGASISRKTNFKSSIWKWQRRHFRKLLEVARFSLRDVTMAKIVRTNKLPSSPPPPPCLLSRNVCPGSWTFQSTLGGWGGRGVFLSAAVEGLVRLNGERNCLKSEGFFGTGFYFITCIYCKASNPHHGLRADHLTFLWVIWFV